MHELFDGAREKQSDLDTVIEKAAPEWPIDKIAMVDRNILRLGLYELLFGDRDQVPPKVAINEAIELAKSFGGETSGRFVNGVLGAVYKEMGEPGNDDTSKRKDRQVNDAELPIRHLCGAVVYAFRNNDIYLALVHDIFGHWTLSKDGLEDGEDHEAGVERVVKEELGLEASVETKLGENAYVASDPEKGKLRKSVTYFLARAPYGEITLGESGGLDDAQWFPVSEVNDLNLYDDITPIVSKAVNMVTQEEK
jgi:ADP-ribose pyrophosphatase YjhB (NUDIX family)